MVTKPVTALQFETRTNISEAVRESMVDLFTESTREVDKSLLLPRIALAGVA